MAEDVFGLRISYHFSDENKTEPSLRAEFHIAKGTQSQGFFTSPALQIAIKENGLKEGDKLGWISLVHDTKTNSIVWRRFYPYNNAKRHLFERKGIGLDLYSIVKKEALQRFPTATKVAPWRPSIPFEAFLKKLGYSKQEIVSGIPLRKEGWLIRKTKAKNAVKRITKRIFNRPRT